MKDESQIDVTFNVLEDAVRALKLFISPKDIRPWLRHICFEYISKQMCFTSLHRAIATDGVKVLAYAPMGDEVRRGEHTVGRVLLSPSVFDPIKVKGGSYTIILTGDARAPNFTITSSAGARFGESSDLGYCDWREMIPQVTSGEVGQFDPEHLVTFAKAAKIVRSTAYKGAVTVAHNGERAALVRIGDHRYLGLLMPMRAENPVRTAPRWAKE